MNAAWRRVFPRPGALTIGLAAPLEAYAGDVPRLERQPELVRRAEALGFAAIWVRDIPLRDPSFGDVGQVHEPFTYLGYLAAATSSIALATGSVILSLRHPIDIGKAAASVDVLSGGRLLLGVASGDRPVEYPAYGVDPASRAARFAESVALLRRLTEQHFPGFEGPLGALRAGSGDLLPKPVAGRLPLLVTGHSGQSLDWIAREADGWITYPRLPLQQAMIFARWRDALDAAGVGPKPAVQSLYVDLAEDPDAAPTPIHLGWRLGRRPLAELLAALREAGAAHVFLNLKLSRRPAPEVIEELGAELLPILGA